MNWKYWTRQLHRWLSILFTLTVIANFVAMGIGEPPAWLVYAPLAPLFVLMITGLIMFVLPYVSKSHRGSHSARPSHSYGGSAE